MPLINPKRTIICNVFKQSHGQLTLFSESNADLGNYMVNLRHFFLGDWEEACGELKKTFGALVKGIPGITENRRLSFLCKFWAWTNSAAGEGEGHINRRKIWLWKLLLPLPRSPCVLPGPSISSSLHSFKLSIATDARQVSFFFFFFVHIRAFLFMETLCISSFSTFVPSDKAIFYPCFPSFLSHWNAMVFLFVFMEKIYKTSLSSLFSCKCHRFLVLSVEMLCFLYNHSFNKVSFYSRHLFLFLEMLC